MAEQLGMGLSDLGLSAPSDASSISAQDSMLASLMSGDAMISEGANAQNLQGQIADVQGQDVKGLLDRLLSPGGLAKLAASVGLGAAGFGGAGAVLGGLGGIQGMQGEQAAEEQGKVATVQDLRDQLDKSTERLDKLRNRVSTMFNTNPDAFLDEEGHPVVDERVLGWYTTGTQIPVFPQTRRVLNNRDERWTARLNVLKGALESSTNVQDRQALTGAIFDQMQWFDRPPEVEAAIARSIGTEEFDRVFASTLLRHGGASGLDAMIYAGENGLPLHDPDVLRRVSFRDDPADQPPSQVLNQRFIDALDTVNAFSQNPLNAEFVREIKANNSPQEADVLIARQALASKGEGEVKFYLDKVNAMDPDEFRRLFQAYSMVDSKYGLVDTVRQTGSLKETMGMSDEELAAMKMAAAQQSVADTERVSRQNTANQLAATANRVAVSLQDALPTLGIGGIHAMRARIMQAAAEDAKKNADGTLDRADFERLVSAYTTQAIQQNKQ